MRQAELSSQVFEQTDHQGHLPMQKRSKYDVNNMKDEVRQKNHLYSDINGQGGHQAEVKSPNKKVASDLVLSSNNWAHTDVKS
jgi:hypothetical protein